MKTLAYHTITPDYVQALRPAHRWWLRPLQWLLGKLGLAVGEWAPCASERATRYKPESVLDLARDQISTLMRWGQRPVAIIVGREQQIELFKDDEAYLDYMSFDVDPEGWHPELFGVRLVLHPLIDGLVVVAEQNDNKTGL